MDFAAAISSGNWAAAIKSLDASIAQSSELAVPLLLNRAFCNLKLQLFRKALKDCDEVLQAQPRNVEALSRKGRCLVALKKSQEASVVWTQALEAASSITDAQVILELTSLLKDPSTAGQQDIATPSAPATPSPSSSPVGSAGTATPTTQLNGTAVPARKAEAPAAAVKQPPATASAAKQGSTKQANGSKPTKKDDENVETLDCATSQQLAAAVRERQASAPSAGPINAAIAIQLAVTQINNGKVDEALQLLDQVVCSNPRELGGLVARGTARALKRDLKGAIADFTAAIEVEPRYADTWKRRGQSRSALGGMDEEALSDLQKAMELLPPGVQESSTSRAECLLERAMIFQKRRDFRRACQELKEGVKLEPKNHQMWNVLGLCSTSQGNIREGVAAYEQAVRLKPDLKESWLNMAQALKEEGRTSEAERAFNKALALDAPDHPSITAYRVMAQMRQQKGNHKAAIDILDKTIAFKKDDGMIELLFQRAICHHALGHTREAVRDYEECLGWTKGNISEDSRSFQYLSFYQKDMALYLYHNLDKPVKDLCLDAELHPLFKELWCKKGPPTGELISQYRVQPPMPSNPPAAPKRTAAKLQEQDTLTALADRFGKLLQYQHQGFLPNVRQQRAAGLAAIELAQAVSELLTARRAGKTVWVGSQGSSSQAGSSGRHQFGWRDAMDIVVKWRQLSEPNDQVVWVDLLTRREFEQGFGSHTPMFTGQTKCVRYYMNFSRAFELLKEVLLREGHAFDAQNRPLACGSAEQIEAIKAATTAQDMYHVLRHDSWVVVPIHSLHEPGKTMEGTRLTLVQVPNQPDAYEFSIRTPVTPPRWKQFDAELEVAWEAVLQAMLQGDRPQAARHILSFTYYWYNFMPLARGTAACGYTTILSLFWAAGMPISTSIPKDYQVDWEAILAQHPEEFVASVSKWLYPAAARGEVHVPSQDFPEVSSLPAVAEVLTTLRHRIEALNGESLRH